MCFSQPETTKVPDSPINSAFQKYTTSHDQVLSLSKVPIEAEKRITDTASFLKEPENQIQGN